MEFYSLKLLWFLPNNCSSWLSSAFHIYMLPTYEQNYKSTDLLLEILQILTENDETPADCATAVVNKDLTVYLQLQGALDADAEREKLRKKKDEIQK